MKAGAMLHRLYYLAPGRDKIAAGAAGGPGRSRLSLAVAVMVALLATLPAMAAGPRQSTPAPAWRFDTGGRPLGVVPAVARDGTAFIAAGDGALYAVALDGHARWSVPTGIAADQTTLTRPAIGSDDASYWNVRGSIVAVSPSGHVRWVYLTSAGGSPVLTRGRLLVAADGYLYAIATTGRRAGQALWRAAAGATGGSAATAAPAIGLGGSAYVASPDGYLYAIAPNGLRRWAVRIGVPLVFSPAVGLDGTVYVDAFASGRGVLYAVTPGGRVRWRRAVPSGSDIVRGPNGTVYVAAHLLVAISPGGRVLWRRPVDAAAPPATVGSLVIVPTLSPPALLALDTRGATRWRVPLSVDAVGAPAVGPAGRLYSGDYAGSLTMLAPGAHGHLRAVRAQPAHGAPLDLGAGNPPFVVSQERRTWRATVAQTVEVSGDRTHWRTVLDAGNSTLDTRTGLYHNARYARIAFLATDPHDPHGLYVGTAGALGDYSSGGRGGADGGLFYSATGVAGWSRRTQGLPFTYEPRLRVATYALDSLVVDPAHRGVLYAQTPATFGSPGHDAGLYKSGDGGRHWQAAMRGLRTVVEGSTLTGLYHAFPPGALLVDRARPSVLFLIAPTGFYRSGDAAANWHLVAGVSYADPASVAVRIGPRGIVRAYTDRGVYVSRDHGAHWRRSR